MRICSGRTSGLRVRRASDAGFVRNDGVQHACPAPNFTREAIGWRFSRKTRARDLRIPGINQFDSLPKNTSLRKLTAGRQRYTSEIIRLRMIHSKTPIILFSLQRAGSTLVQRVLGAHPAIATAAEPNLLLPLVYALRNRGMYTEYNHHIVARSIDRFCALLPRGQGDYYSAAGSFAAHLYGLASGSDQRYFLDKTPRYHVIAEEIFDMFKNGKFIFLWRNPLAVTASMVDTFCHGRWQLHRFKLDLFEGLQNLVAVYQKQERRACAIKYEDVISDPETSCRRLFDYLELPFDANVLTGFKDVALKGLFFDHKDIRLYKSFSSEPLVKWRTTLASPFRKAWCRHYLNWIGRERLAVMGYDLDALTKELNAIPSHYRGLVADLYQTGRGAAICALEPRIFTEKAKLLPSWHRVHTHL